MKAITTTVYTLNSYFTLRIFRDGSAILLQLGYFSLALTGKCIKQQNMSGQGLLLRDATSLLKNLECPICLNVMADPVMFSFCA